VGLLKIKQQSKVGQKKEKSNENYKDITFHR